MSRNSGSIRKNLDGTYERWQMYDETRSAVYWVPATEAEFNNAKLQIVMTGKDSADHFRRRRDKYVLIPKTWAGRHTNQRTKRERKHRQGRAKGQKEGMKK